MSRRAAMPPQGEALWSALPVPALILGGEARILAANPAAEQFLRRSADALAGRPLDAVLEGGQALAAALGRLGTHAAPMVLAEVALGPAEREQVPCQVDIAPFGSAGEALVIIHPQEMAARLRSAGQVAAAARAASGMVEMLAHEIRNPLSGIIGAAQLLEMSADEASGELTRLIVGEARRILDLLAQVEEVGNLRPPRLAPVNVHDVLDRARRSAELGLAREMRFREDFDPSLPEALGDADQLVQALQNLIRNAAEACGPGGTITLRTFYDRSIRLRRGEGRAVRVPLQIEVEDDGPGIPPEIRDAIFEPFVSGRQNGTGLGLALVSRIVSDHGGLVSVTSRPGRTVFRLSLRQAGEVSASPAGDSAAGREEG